MKKTWYYPIIGSVAVLVWYVACFFIPSPEDGVIFGLGYPFIGSVLIAVLFPMIFSWSASKHTKLIIIPALYTTAVFTVPWIGMMLEILRSGTDASKKAAICVLFTVFIWNLMWMAGVRVYRKVRAKRKAAAAERKAEEARLAEEAKKAEAQKAEEESSEENKAEENKAE